MSSRHTRAAIVDAWAARDKSLPVRASAGARAPACATPSSGSARSPWRRSTSGSGRRSRRARRKRGRSMRRRTERAMIERRWDARCSEIVRRMAGHYHDHEIAASIEAETGKRFMARTVAEYRRLAGLAPCRRNDWTRRLKVRRRSRTAGTSSHAWSMMGPAGMRWTHHCLLRRASPVRAMCRVVSGVRSSLAAVTRHLGGPRRPIASMATCRRRPLPWGKRPLTVGIRCRGLRRAAAGAEHVVVESRLLCGVGDGVDERESLIDLPVGQMRCDYGCFLQLLVVAVERRAPGRVAHR